MADELKPTYGLPEALRGQRKKRSGRRTRVIVDGGEWVYSHIEGAPSKENFTATIDRAIENIELTRRRMANDQIEIDRLRIETQQMIAELLT